MTHTVLRARLRSAGLADEFFDGADLDLIGAAMRELPSVPAQPTLDAPTRSGETGALLDAVIALAEGCLGALEQSALLFAFSQDDLCEKVTAAVGALGDALPDLQARCDAILCDGESGCLALTEQMREANGDLRRLGCLHAAAVLAGSPMAEDYRTALRELESAIAGAEVALLALERDMSSLDALLTAHIPTLLGTALPLFEGHPRAFSTSDYRRAALTLRETARRIQGDCHVH